LTPHLLNERVCLEAVLLLARQEVHDIALAAELLIVAPLGARLLLPELPGRCGHGQTVWQTEAPGLAGASSTAPTSGISREAAFSCETSPPAPHRRQLRPARKARGGPPGRPSDGANPPPAAAKPHQGRSGSGSSPPGQGQCEHRVRG
jgi:hypothetical protein